MRFRRTKAEILQGLTPNQARVGRGYQPMPSGIENPQPPDSPSGAVPLKKRKKGGLVIRINPGKDVDSDYFEHLSDREIEVTQDNDFYKWLDLLVSKVYDTHGKEKLFSDILSEGIGQILTTKKFSNDINN